MLALEDVFRLFVIASENVGDAGDNAGLAAAVQIAGTRLGGEIVSEVRNPKITATVELATGTLERTRVGINTNDAAGRLIDRNLAEALVACVLGARIAADQAVTVAIHRTTATGNRRSRARRSRARRGCGRYRQRCRSRR